ncbi:transposase [Brevibacillus sp. NRS-1366]
MNDSFIEQNLNKETSIFILTHNGSILPIPIFLERCAGLDVHQETIVACVMFGSLDKRAKKEIRTFGTTTKELLQLQDWLAEYNCTDVAMESTGVYWKPVWNRTYSNYWIISSRRRRGSLSCLFPDIHFRIKNCKAATPNRIKAILRFLFSSNVPKEDMTTAKTSIVNILKKGACVQRFVIAITMPIIEMILNQRGRFFISIINKFLFALIIANTLIE